MAPFVQRAVYAVGLLRMANPSAVEYQPVVGFAPIALWNNLFKLLFGLFGSVGVRKPQAVLNAEHVRVNGYGVAAEGHGVDDVCRLLSHARKTFKPFVFGGHFSSEFFNYIARG